MKAIGKNLIIIFLITSCSLSLEALATQDVGAWTPTPELTATPIPTKTLQPTPTTNLYQYNGYWVSPIDKGSNVYIQTYGNMCPPSIDPFCIENWKGEIGMYPDDVMKVMVCPFHEYAWDFWWDHQGENVYAVQGGKVTEIELEDDSTIGVHFMITDIKPDNWYGANYGHVNIHSMVENRIITEDQAAQILTGEVLNGGLVYEGQLIGVTGDDCCGFGVLHIGTGWGGFEGLDPADLWLRSGGQFPDYIDSLPPDRLTVSDVCGPLWFVERMINEYRGKYK